ncbi:MAG TPA: alkaline phosphatase family protein [Polyangia bacterium]|nr:alkaline phosphatase family protein [Polyangia bacterium]
MRRTFAALGLVAAAACGGGKGAPQPQPSRPHVITIDIDDHGLAGLWMANAPHLRGLIARGTLAYSRVLVPTHSNQNNIALLSGQYPEGHSVPSNSWLSRARDFAPPLAVSGLDLGDYAVWEHNPLRVRGDSVYQAVRRAGERSVYFGQLPPFEAGADEVHLTILGASFSGNMITANLASGIMTDLLHYPKSVVDGYHLQGPPPAGQTYLQFTVRQAAKFVRATTAQNPMPDFMFIWDFIAIDGDPTSTYGAGGSAIVKIVEDFDQALGDLLAALTDKGLLDDTNILFTLDHGKVDTHNQVALGSQGQSMSSGGATVLADGQLGARVAARGPQLGISASDYTILNEDGDALVYARVPGAGTAAGAARQAEVTRALLTIIQSGEITGLDITRTMTADGALRTRTFHDFRASGPNQADILVYPQEEWTLNQVDQNNSAPGPFQEHTAFPFGRHGGFAADELYVPLIMAGPAFKQGVIIPHPVEHPDVAPTALAPLASARLDTAARGPIRAALAGDPAETLPQPADLSSSRIAVLDASGYGAPLSLAGAAAGSAVIIDLAGVYQQELFENDGTATAAQPVRDLAAGGTLFNDIWARSRDWPVNEYQMLAGGYPTSPQFAVAAEDDPTQTVAPGPGLLQMPPVPGFIANRAAYEAWRQPAPFARESLFDAAHALGLTTALIGQPDFHALHLAGSSIDVTVATDAAGAAAALHDLRAQHPRWLAVVALGGARAGSHTDAAGQEQLAALASAAAAIAREAEGALVAITSRGATEIDAPDHDLYGPGSSRHVPLLLLGPNVRAGVVSGQPGSLADLPATILFGLGAATVSDVGTGTWAQGTSVGGVPQPTPNGATEGRALVRGYLTR